MRDPPPARRFIDMAYLVAGQQAPRAPQAPAPAPAPADYQQPPSSQAPGLAAAPGRVPVWQPQNQIVVLHCLDFFSSSIFELSPLSCIPQLISSSSCCVLCFVSNRDLDARHRLHYSQTSPSFEQTSSAPRQPRLLPALYSAAFQCTRRPPARRTQDGDLPVSEASNEAIIPASIPELAPRRRSSPSPPATTNFPGIGIEKPPRWSKKTTQSQSSSSSSSSSSPSSPSASTGSSPSPAAQCP